MSTHLTRKELTQDNVALKVEETFDFFKHHRKELVRYGGAAVAAAVIIAGVFYYRSAQHDAREQALADALALQAAPVGSAAPSGGPSFQTDAAKQEAVQKAYVKIAADYGGSEEGYAAELALAGMDVDAGKLTDARKKFEDVADHANSGMASLGKLSLAQIDFAENKSADAQKILKYLEDHPTDMVSKAQAEYTLAKGIAATQPAEAKKLLMALASSKDQSDVSGLAVTALGELQKQ